MTGIIPARAGFTPAWSISSPTRSDHPRSRGVYSTRAIWWRRAPGSSPLARGLLPGRVGGSPEFRIIPARAGFTGVQRGLRPRVRDHPRSRGVYSTTASVVAELIGSSPLARGLLHRTLPRELPSRIIPARAGFTPAARPASARPRDHPRSRGVYPIEGQAAAEAAGSSPLARGLPHRRECPHARRGIIPARAGFTRKPMRAAMRALGSSPLARGLRVGTGRVGQIRLDHPRSRGVYE